MSETAQIKESEQQGTSQFYYTVAGQHILLEAGIKTEIIEQRDIFPIPHTPTWCLGMISLRGKLIPVANLHTLFGNPEPNKSHWLLVLEQAPYPQIAIRIDQLPQQRLINNEPHESIKDQKLPDWLVASVLLDEQMLFVANHSKLFERFIQENETQPNPNRDSSGNSA